MLVDLPDDRPDSCGITMTSHQALFGTLKRIIPQHIDTPEPMPAEDLVDRAQHEIGVTLEDSSTQGHFAELVRNQLLPGAVARAHAQALSASGVALAIWGKNWTLGQVGESTTDEGIPAGEALNGLFGSSDIAVFPWCRETEMETALDAMAAGLNVVCRAPDEAFEEVFPGLSPLVPHLHLYRTGRELADTVASLQASPDECRERAGVARSLVLAGYCVSHRLLTIVDHVRNRGCTLG